jgi:hypothetical protein
VGTGGLKLWLESQPSGEKADRERYGPVIAQFLLAEGKISAAVVAFLRSASDEEILQRLITTIEWDTDAAEAPDVVQEVEDHLVILGEKSGVTSEKATEVADHLS